MAQQAKVTVIDGRHVCDEGGALEGLVGPLWQIVDLNELIPEEGDGERGRWTIVVVFEESLR